MIKYHSESSGFSTKVEFFRPSEGSLYDDLGVHPRNDVPEYKCFGQLIPQTGSRIQVSDGYFLERTTHKLIIRYNKRSKLLTADMTALIGDNNYQILYILDPYEKHETLEIFLEHKLRGSGY